MNQNESLFDISIRRKNKEIKKKPHSITYWMKYIDFIKTIYTYKLKILAYECYRHAKWMKKNYTFVYVVNERSCM